MLRKRLNSEGEEVYVDEGKGRADGKLAERCRKREERTRQSDLDAMWQLVNADPSRARDARRGRESD